MDNNSQLKYSDERERTYGLAGMVLSLVVTEDTPPFDEVNLDAPLGEAIAIDSTPLMQYSEASDISRAFRRNLRGLQLGARMTFSNVLSRYTILRHSELGKEDYKSLYDVLHDYALDTCSLEDDEARQLIEQEYEYTGKIFRHPSVVSILTSLADNLGRRRRLSRHDIVDMVSRLTR